MSNALALAGVTSVLQYYLSGIYNSPTSVFGTVDVSAVAPDIVQTGLGTGSNTPLQVNLFMHQVTPNEAWRNTELPSLAADGVTRLQNQPLALDLHYLMTAYGGDDTQAEALLGYGILMFHENPIIARQDIRNALDGLASSHPFASVLKYSGLADQIEMIKITPSSMGREELAWVWTALKADYRLSYPFEVSVVLIQADSPSAFSLPVLSRSITIQAGPTPQIDQVQPPKNQSAAAQGDTVILVGEALSGAGMIALTNPRLGISYPPFAPISVTANAITFSVPTDAVGLPAGNYYVAAQFLDSHGNIVNTTNSMPMGVAPKIPTPPTYTLTPNAAGTLVTIDFGPEAQPNQTVTLGIGSNAASAETFESATGSLSFQFATLTPGSYLARLQVDGVDSPIGFTLSPPAFTGPFVVV